MKCSFGDDLSLFFSKAEMLSHCSYYMLPLMMLPLFPVELLPNDCDHGRTSFRRTASLHLGGGMKETSVLCSTYGESA